MLQIHQKKKKSGTSFNFILLKYFYFLASFFLFFHFKINVEIYDSFWSKKKQQREVKTIQVTRVILIIFFIIKLLFVNYLTKFIYI